MRNEPFIAPDNPYASLDRGMFISRDLLLSNGKKEDRFCRIGHCDVFNFQGVANFCIVNYQVFTWETMPETPEQYAAYDVYKDPVSGSDTFTFSDKPVPFDVFRAESFGIESFIRDGRRLTGAKKETFADFYAKYSPDEEHIWPSADDAIAVNYIVHQQSFVSVKGAPLVPLSSRLRYRGYGLSDPDKLTVAPGQVYRKGAFIYADKPFKNRDGMIADALAHFTVEGRAAAKQLFMPS